MSVYALFINSFIWHLIRLWTCFVFLCIICECHFKHVDNASIVSVTIWSFHFNVFFPTLFHSVLFLVKEFRLRRVFPSEMEHILKRKSSAFFNSDSSFLSGLHRRSFSQFLASCVALCLGGLFSHSIFNCIGSYSLKEKKFIEGKIQQTTIFFRKELFKHFIIGHYL